MLLALHLRANGGGRSNAINGDYVITSIVAVANIIVSTERIENVIIIKFSADGKA